MHTESKINDRDNLIPDNYIVAVTENPALSYLVDKIVEPLAGKTTRDWFIKHAYYCLPLVVGNQYGFGIKSLYDFTLEWNGGQQPGDLIVTVDNNGMQEQIISSHFGMGIVTIQNRFHFRTPLGINLVTMNPPNMFVPHIQNLTGVVETDNLRRDFTFNIKVTTPNVKVSIKAGDIIAAMLPVPRFSVENYKVVLADTIFSEDVIKNERDAGLGFAKERSQDDINKPNGNGRRYARGVDIYDNPFYQHQKTVRPTSR